MKNKDLIKIIIFSIIGCLLFMAIDVNAATSTHMQFYSVWDNNCGFNIEAKKVINNAYFNGGSSPSNTGACQTAMFVSTDVNLVGTYDISGLIYFGLGSNFSSNNLSGSKPIIQLNGKSCVIDNLVTDGSYSTNGSMGNSLVGYYTYTCSDVTLVGNNRDWVNFVKNAGSYSWHISETIYYSAHVTNSQIIDSQNQNQQQTNDRLDETNKNLGDLNNNITDSDVSDANSSSSDFFNGFESNDFGLSSIITAPLNLIKSITSSTCTPIGFKAPFVNQQVTLPCMSSIYKEFFGGFLTIYQTITFGIVAYWVCVNTFATVKGFKDPDSDRIEVLDL